MLNTSSHQLSETAWSPLSLFPPFIYLQFNKNLLSSRKRKSHPKIPRSDGSLVAPSLVTLWCAGLGPGAVGADVLQHWAGGVPAGSVRGTGEGWRDGGMWAELPPISQGTWVCGWKIPGARLTPQHGCPPGVGAKHPEHLGPQIAGLQGEVSSSLSFPNTSAAASCSLLPASSFPPLHTPRRTGQDKQPSPLWVCLRGAGFSCFQSPQYNQQ